MKNNIICLSLLLFFTNSFLFAQDTLPNFSLRNVGGNRIVIGWNNNFQDIRQLSIQRSADSLSGYKTILTLPDPATPQNGYVDSKAPNGRMFYRLYIMLDKGIFLFSNAKRPILDTIRVRDTVANNDTIQVGDSVVVVTPFGVKIDKFPGKDSAAVPNLTKNRPPAFVPSLMVFTNRDGYVRIVIPGDEIMKKYTVKFFEEDGSFLFEIKNFTERDFKLDKSSFYHAGWFNFELYEEQKLMEKHKFYLSKDF